MFELSRFHTQELISVMFLVVPTIVAGLRCIIGFWDHTQKPISVDGISGCRTLDAFSDRAPNLLIVFFLCSCVIVLKVNDGEPDTLYT